MPRAKDVRRHVEDDTFIPSRHARLLTDEERAIYDHADGGEAGRVALLDHWGVDRVALDFLPRGADEAGRRAVAL